MTGARYEVTWMVGVGGGAAVPHTALVYSPDGAITSGSQTVYVTELEAPATGAINIAMSVPAEVSTLG
jgi:hypothetical protein